MVYGGEIKCMRYGILMFMIFCILVILNTPRSYFIPKQVIGWEVNVTREAHVYVLPGNETSLISGAGICQTGVRLVIVVTSAPHHFDQRVAIRKTWGSHNISSVRVCFILGIPTNSSVQPLVEEEASTFADIIQEGFIDTYNNLTVKSLMMLKWVQRRCPEADFLMKTDDDMFVNVSRIERIVSSLQPRQTLIGSLICRARPILDTQNKWYSPKYMYGRKEYPPYLSGVAYIMSEDVVRKIYHTALTTQIFHLEDVFLTGICAAKVGLKPRNHNGFTYLHVVPMCDPQLATNHRFSADELESLWKAVPNCTAAPSKKKPPSKNPCH